MEDSATNELLDTYQDRITSLELLVEQQQAEIKALEEIIASQTTREMAIKEVDARFNDFIAAQDALLAAREVVIEHQRKLISALRYELTIWKRNVAGQSTFIHAA